MKQVTKKEVIKKILETKGQIFSAVFIKKDLTERTILCRLGVKKGVNGKGLKFDALSKGLLPVYDVHKDGYRMLNLNTLKAVQIKKEVYLVKEGV